MKSYSKKVKDLVSDFLTNGNCWAHLWFEDKEFNHLTAEERSDCIELAVAIKNGQRDLDIQLDELEKLHP